ncbi:RNA polymerase sigma factor (sigma-70 family) [Breznakia sp. PF5-3]|uniref:RNA polymerase sigma factor n=1 Tax=unclassified Breznakia TaxID=2623764 RepID=UPI002405B966|nr:MULTISPECIES: sigma-70 family RNA polymerase sigma factor [unclassified Breznakia]MDF9823996.1 RNA polymerase sigma factor (sigma-70 family) [Breznakia sp. PM6-1]MDF9834795.1 RNA polymerase sigma factor (sigma-70 family) [Breznakia sp. PF5-3]MDF9838062.1 RNA polymerase sigma factor (sigma-70 family) [Breznakia sp. PFB2-8]MDF9860048.1 RNA polymerase sigma factor (sigma-70 family) [Breznakia sp. PH5-24]
MSEIKKNPITSQIVLAFQNGDTEAFEKIYEHYHKRIYFFTLNHINDPETAKDIIQNTFISVYRNIRKLKYPEAFHVWIMKIAYSEIQNIIRKPKFQTIKLSTNKETDDYVDRHTAVENTSLEDQVLYDLIYTKISSLKPKFKDVASLKYLEGYTEIEISQILHIPLGTVKSRLRRIKTSLQDTLIENDITPSTYKAPAIIITPLLYKTYEYMYSLETSTVDNHHSATTVIASAATEATILSSLTLKLTLVASTIIIGGTLLLVNQPNNDKTNTDVTNTIIEHSKIKDIHYNQEFTNEPISIRVDTTNDNYDKILLNNKEDLIIKENGTYSISLIKDNKTIDQKEIHIKNIDYDLPEYLSYQLDGEICTVYLKDQLSGVNNQSISYFKNEVASEDYTYDELSQTIVFKYQKYSSNIFFVSDNAGNEIKVSLESEKYFSKK